MRLRDVITFEPIEKYINAAFEMSMAEERLTIYDSLYLAQADRYGTILTSDEKQWEIAKKIGVNAIYVE